MAVLNKFKKLVSEPKGAMRNSKVTIKMNKNKVAEPKSIVEEPLENKKTDMPK